MIFGAQVERQLVFRLDPFGIEDDDAGQGLVGRQLVLRFVLHHLNRQRLAVCALAGLQGQRSEAEVFVAGVLNGIANVSFIIKEQDARRIERDDDLFLRRRFRIGDFNLAQSEHQGLKEAAVGFLASVLGRLAAGFGEFSFGFAVDTVGLLAGVANDLIGLAATLLFGIGAYAVGIGTGIRFRRFRCVVGVVGRSRRCLCRLRRR